MNRLEWSYTTHDQLDCYNKEGTHLGWLEYERTGTFMHWCWNQCYGIKMSPGCVEEMRLKQKGLGKKTRVHSEDGLYNLENQEGTKRWNVQ